jgi:hypothetical protein
MLMKHRTYHDNTGEERVQIIFDSIEEAEKFYNDSLHRILQNPKFYLEHLEEMVEFQVPWLSYSGKEFCHRKRRFYAITHPKTEKLINKS